MVGDERTWVSLSCPVLEVSGVLTGCNTCSEPAGSGGTTSEGRRNDHYAILHASTSTVWHQARPNAELRHEPRGLAKGRRGVFRCQVACFFSHTRIALGPGVEIHSATAAAVDFPSAPIAHLCTSADPLLRTAPASSTPYNLSKTVCILHTVLLSALCMRTACSVVSKIVFSSKSFLHVIHKTSSSIISLLSLSLIIAVSVHMCI